MVQIFFVIILIKIVLPLIKLNYTNVHSVVLNQIKHDVMINQYKHVKQ